MSYIEDYVEKLREFEGEVAWMYLDTEGNVTVARGQMLPNAEAALALPFRSQASGDLLGEIDVRKDFARVSAMEAGHLPGYYHDYESPVMNEADIEALTLARVNDFDISLRRLMPGHAAAPSSAKLANLDMGYNLGLEKLIHKFPHYCSGFNAGDFRTAAANCHRIGPNPARNTWTRLQLLSAAGEAA